MKIECTVEELKELIKTPVAEATDVEHSYNSNYVKGSVCMEQSK